MTSYGAERTSEELLILQSELGNLALISPWIERMACTHSISAHTKFAMNLCLEEILSNIIRHGYADEPGHNIAVRYSRIDKSNFQIVIEDQAPPFNPLTAEVPPIEDTLEGKREGGLGIRLFKNFVGNAKYEATPAGNRLSILFSDTIPTQGQPGE